MIARIIEFSARNPFLMLMLVVVAIGGGVWATLTTPLDAIPDLSDVQVIVATDWADRSPNIIEDQITYPIVTQLLSAPKVKAVRANSFYGSSLIYVIFEDGTDLYWAQPGARILERHGGQIAPRCLTAAGARCDRRRLGVGIRADRQDRQTLTGGTADAPGLAGSISNTRRPRRR
jgi:AcrB/AcrD/AcrF family